MSVQRSSAGIDRPAGERGKTRPTARVRGVIIENNAMPAGVRNGEEAYGPGRYRDVRHTKRTGNGGVQPVDRHGGVSRQVPIRVLPGHTERGRAVLFRVFGRSHLLLVGVASDHHARTRPARHGLGLGKGDRGRSRRTRLGKHGIPDEEKGSQ